ncbi:isoamylase early set domain-containing protein [Saccharicrinis sp. FJH2]|uniref:isoamylase early set domain-containing protein n=1 Tax=unclassified Saccharicrinis TaxID=2646859 RepID=UPI0035D4350F
MSFKKTFLKSKPVCKVAFRLSKSEVESASDVKILGSFNNWDKGAEPMKQLKNGDFTATVELPVDQEIEFRYLVNNSSWINDSEAEGFISNAFGDTNSLISTRA